MIQRIMCMIYPEVLEYLKHPNHSKMKEEHKLQHSKLVRIDSKDREIGSKSQYDFKISTNDFMLHNVRRIVLKSVIIPNTQYNVTSINNILSYSAPDLGIFDAAFSLELGNYRLPELANILTTAFTLAPTPIALVVQTSTLKGKLTFQFDTRVVLHGADSTLRKIIGLGEEDLVADASNNRTVQMPFMPDLSGMKKIYIGSHALTRGTTMTSSDKSHTKIFTEVPITVPYGAIEHRSLSDLHSLDEVTPSVPLNLSHIDITLYDQNLNIVDLNGIDVQIVIKVFTAA